MDTVAVVGAGAVGSYYGARLSQAGHDVHFLLRRDYEAVAKQGLRIESHHGDFYIESPTISRDSSAIGPVDWVLCALKATSLGEASALVRPCLGPETRVLAIVNGLGIEEELARVLDRENIFGGLAFTCINRGEPGVIHHYDYGQVVIGHLGDDPVELERALALWQGATVEVSRAPSLLRARWEKLCWNVPFNGLTVAEGGITTELIVTDSTLRKEACALMEEVVKAGNADLAARDNPERIDGEEVITRMFTLTDAMGPYRPSTLIDFLEGRRIEVDAIFGEPVRRARALGVETPRLERLAALLSTLNPEA
ncbi:MAG: 2-dehydropantoate 2-reductase [Dehalococcoidia bacterium]|nr:2-dehydropantoate 2-reductase [Dehalococcoidia bacterium]|tara:strand:- start:1515 stop:2447 length:933 start_codon:yes stop_codon:yes gene_type:complete